MSCIIIIERFRFFNGSMTRSKSAQISLNTLLSQVFVPYCLRICFVLPWYPGYQATAKQIRSKYGVVSELRRIFQESSKNIVRILSELNNRLMCRFSNLIARINFLFNMRKNLLKLQYLRGYVNL